MAAAAKPTTQTDIQNAKAAQAAVAGAGIGAADGVGVEKIRDLLFGNQMQDYDRRFSTLEERFQLKLRDLEADSARSIGALETTMKKQLESVANQFREEKDLRADADKELERGLRDHTQTLEKRLSQMSDQLARIEREFTDRLGHETQALRDEIKRRNEDMRETMERMFAELSNVKTDRNLLAGLFVEIAKCLNQEITPGFSKGNSEHH